MAFVEARNIVKEFTGVRALDDVSLSIKLGTIHCVIGENGAWKSTLIKILTGLYTPDAGTITIDGKNVYEGDNKKLFNMIAYAPQELNLFREMSVAENLFIPFEKSGIGRKVISKNELYDRAVPWLERFQINAKPGDLVKNISVSDQQLLQIARAMVNENAQVLMLDEPTTSLTTKEIDRLFSVIKQLKEKNKAIIFISHKLEEIFALGDAITVLRNGVKVAGSNVADTTIPQVISQMAGREIAQTENYRSEKVSGDVLLEVKNLCGSRFRDVSFTLHKGEILGFSGLIGSGRTEIMQALFGYLPVWSGSVAVEGREWKLGSTVFSTQNGFIYLPEERKQHGILAKMSVAHNISVPLLHRITKGLGVSSKKEKQMAGEVVNAYAIKIAAYDQLIQYLSGGNQPKVIVGRSIFARPRILVFDEPTKGIDVGSKVEIYKLMKQFAEEKQIGIILISSELEEVLKCANRVIAMYSGETAGEFTAPVDKTAVLNAIMGVRERHEQ